MEIQNAREEKVDSGLRKSKIIPSWWHNISIIHSPLILLGPEAQIAASNENACEVLGYSHSELELISLLDITHKDDQVDEVKNYIDLFYGSRNFKKTHKTFISKDNKDIPVVQHIYAMPDKESGIQYALVTFESKEHSYLLSDKREVQLTLSKLSGLANKLDIDEFGSYNNKEVIVQIQSKVNVLIKLLKISKEL